MNILDIPEPKDMPENIWPAIFEKQRQIAIKYKEIEEMGTLLETTAINIDTRQGQKWIKDFAWRVTEEITEGLEALEFSISDSANKEEHYIHYLEELIDALHFLVELAIIAGYKAEIVKKNEAIIKQLTERWDIIYYLGLMCNCLKNKPWKQTEMLTDRPKFEKYLEMAFTSLLNIFQQEKLSDAAIYTLYFKKNEVNKFRIRSKY